MRVGQSILILQNNYREDEENGDNSCNCYRIVCGGHRY